jgi:PKD repeat protein
MYIGSIEVSQDGTVLYSKSNDQCNQTASPNYTHVETTSAFTLNGGGNYTVKIGSGPTYQTHIGVWIDLNGDGDFDDDKEFISDGWADMNANSTTSYKFTVPCANLKSGVTRMRFATDYFGSPSMSSGSSCNTFNYGETEDYTITLQNSSSLDAGFHVIKTAYVKTKVNFVNNNQSGYIGHAWDIGDDGAVEYLTTNATHKFTTTGKHCVRLTSVNCLGSDEEVNCVNIVTPTAPPVADFVAASNKIELYEEIELTDLSTNGAIYWEWFMFQKTDSADTHIAIAEGGSDEDQNPTIFTAKDIPGFPGPGKWCIGLTSSNDVGSSVTVIKCDYIEILKGCDVEMGPGTITSIPGNVITCKAGSMKSKDDGTGNYSKNESGLDALIAPCGATKIGFVFDKWKVKKGVNLKVYDGPDATGKPLHPNNGFNETDVPTDTLYATSGAMYFLWSSGTLTDEGFIGRWNAVLGTQDAPTADFEISDTLYNSVYNTFTNTSENAIGEVFYTWEVDGNVESNSKDLEKIFLSNTNYNVCMTVETCAGKDKMCKNIVVAPITSKANLTIEADNRRPKAGDEVSFTATSDKANTFEWEFFPNKTVQFIGGTNANSKNPMVKFTAAGKYNVLLKAWNNLTPTDSATSFAKVIEPQYVIVIDYCKPVIGVTTSADIAINRVLMQDNASPRNTLIENESTESAYTNYVEEVRAAELTFGQTCNLNISRLTNANTINRKVWIDWNIDGDFNDAGELVLQEGTTSDKDFVGSFVVPDLANSFEGATRMRIGASYSNDPNAPCGATSGLANANRIGEFEDYAINLSNDNTFPYITLIGDDTAYVEIGGTYVDAGATVTDPTEGDITAKRLQTTSDVDENAAGIYYVTYCASDASGNAAPCLRRVVYVVVDQSAPELTLKGNNPEYIEVINGKYEEAGWTAIDKTDGDLKTAVQVSGSVNTFQIGTYKLVYTVQDAQGNIAKAVREVIVRDLEKPTITNDDMIVGSRNVVEVQIQSVFVDRTIPDDNYNNGTFGPLYDYKISPANAQGEADVDTRVKGTTVVTYTCTDETGNQTQLVIDYVVEDYIAPVITLNTLDTVYHNVNNPYTAVEASVSDNFYDYTQVSLSRESDVNPFQLGLYTDQYTATDASGNVSIRNRWVRVIDAESPEISSKVGPIVKLGLFSNVKLSDYLKLTDNYDAPTELLANLQTLYNGVNFYEEGFYAVEFQTSDNSANLSDVYTLYVEVDRAYERITGVETIEGMDLMKVYPNPSNGLFQVSVELPSSEEVSVSVYDVLGNKVANVAEGQLQKGTYLVDMTGNASGMYFVRMTAHNKVYNQKIIIK